ncbi:MAG: hypothetical protein EA403_16695 [Spirochaetaceae bacterium]|nr:MAG: hypothetical protein EA403_16695 [Spirochaetaceae bacterium]
MRIVDIHTIERRDSLILYRRQYTAIAEIEHVSSETVPIRFTIEQSATGSDVSVDVDGELGYPLLPVLRSLKEEIQNRERQGRLP